MSGVYGPDEGWLEVDGAKVQFDSPRAARAGGIEVVYQDLALAALGEARGERFLDAVHPVDADPGARRAVEQRGLSGVALESRQ